MLKAFLSLSSLTNFLPTGWILPAVAIAAPFLSYGYATVKTRWEVQATERAACTARIASIEQKINEAAARQVKEAQDAAAKVSDTPTTPAELARLCQQSPACRDRVRK
jgi:hypothetical protein